MITLRKSADRGHHQEAWLNSYHTFSFHTYQDPAHMGFRDLRVINEDRVTGGQGFGIHPHQDMEIISLVLEGQLEHRDNLGNREVMGPYELQRITAGSGIRHSEVNPDQDKQVHFLQIWILPERKGLEPNYEIRKFPELPANRLTLLVSPDGRDSSAMLRQDALLYYGLMQGERILDFSMKPGRHAWLQIIDGTFNCNDLLLSTGDGAAVSDEEKLRLQSKKGGEFILFDLK